MLTLRKPNRRAYLERKEARYMRQRLTSGERRALALGVLVEKVSRKKVLKQHKGKCGICGERVNPHKFELDHVIPLSKGGTHEYANIQPAHTECNREKADQMPDHVIIKFRRKSRRSKGYVNARRPVKAAA